MPPAPMMKLYKVSKGREALRMRREERERALERRGKEERERVGVGREIPLLKSVLFATLTSS